MYSEVITKVLIGISQKNKNNVVTCTVYKAGDLCTSYYEGHPIKNETFSIVQ